MALTARVDCRRAFRNILDEVYEVLYKEEKNNCNQIAIEGEEIEGRGWFWGMFANGDFFQREEETDRERPKSEWETGGAQTSLIGELLLANKLYR